MNSQVRRSLEDAYSYLFLDARFEPVLDGRVIGGRAVIIAIGLDL
jgi:transposase-like protein